MLLAGVPVFLLPIHLEQGMLARAAVRKRRVCRREGEGRGGVGAAAGGGPGTAEGVPGATPSFFAHGGGWRQGVVDKSGIGGRGGAELLEARSGGG